MAVTQVGTPATPGLTTSVTSGTTGLTGQGTATTWGTGQDRTAGNYLLAIVTACATTSIGATSQNTGTTGWTKLAEDLTQARSVTAIWGKTAAGTDAVPVFAMTCTGTASRTRITCELIELTGQDATTPVDTTYGVGVADVGNVTSLTVTTNGNVAAGGYAVTGCSEFYTSTATKTWSRGAAWSSIATDNASTYGHASYDLYASVPLGAVSNAIGWGSGTITSASAVIVVVNPSGFTAPVQLFDAVGPSAAGAGNAGSLTLSWTHTVGAGVTSGVILVGGSLDLSSDVGATLTCTVDGSGTGVASLGKVESDSQTAGFLQVWQVTGAKAAPGAHTILLTASDNTGDIEGGSLSFTNVASLGSPVTNQGTSAAASAAVTTNTAGNVIAGFVACGDSVNSSGNTSRYVKNQTASAGYATGNTAGATGAATGASVTMSWALASATVWATLAVEVQAASGTTDATATATIYAATGTVPAATAAGTVTTAPATFPATTAFPAPTVRQDQAPAASLYAATGTVQTVTVTAGGNATATPAQVAATAGFPAVTARQDATATATIYAATGTVPAATAAGTVTTAPAVLAATTAVPAPVVHQDVAATATLAARVAAFPVVTASTGLPFITGLAGGGLGYFADQSGKPILYAQCVAWGLPGNAGRWSAGDWQAEMRQFVDTRTAQGFNIARVHVLSTIKTGCLSDNGSTYDGVPPFVTGTSPSSGLNSAYWARVDYLIDYAASKGMVIELNIAFSWDFLPGVLCASWTTQQCTDWGTALGNRYKGKPNITWMFGDDYLSGGGGPYETQFDAIIAAIRATGDTHLVSIEYMPTGSTSRRPLDGNPTDPIGSSFAWGRDYAQWNLCYYYYPTYFAIEFAFQEPSPIPPAWGDGMYLGEIGDDATGARLLRNMVWWALASGARGVSTGANATMFWDSSAALTSLTTEKWFTTMSANVFTAFKSLTGWNLLIPDTSNQLVTAGRGTRAAYNSGEWQAGSTTNYVCASRTPDGLLAVIYCSQAFSITIDQSKMAAGYTAKRVDPASGTATTVTPGATYASAGWGSNSDGGADWVLVLQGPPTTFAPAALAAAPAGFPAVTVTVPAISVTAPAVPATATTAQPTVAVTTARTRVSVRALGTVATGTTSLVISSPAAAVTGDYLIAFVTDRATSGATTAPTGWTRVGGAVGASGRFQVFTATVGAGGLTGTSWTWGSLTTRAQGKIIALYGQAAAPLDGGVTARVNASGTTGTTSITTVSDGDLIIGAFAALASGSTWSAEATTATRLGELSDQAYSTYLSLAIAVSAQATAGATGVSSAEMGTAGANAGILLAILAVATATPAAASATVTVLPVTVRLPDATAAPAPATAAAGFPAVVVTTPPLPATVTLDGPVTVTTAVPAPVLFTPATAAPDAVAAVAAVPDVTASSGGGAAATAALYAAVATVPVVAVSRDEAPAATLYAATAAVPDVTVTVPAADVTIPATITAITAGFPPATVAAGQGAVPAPDAVAAPATVQAVTAVAGGGATATASLYAATGTVQTVTAHQDAAPAAVLTARGAAVPAVSVTAGGSATIAIAAVTVTTGFAAPTVRQDQAPAPARYAATAAVLAVAVRQDQAPAATVYAATATVRAVATAGHTAPVAVTLTATAGFPPATARTGLALFPATVAVTVTFGQVTIARQAGWGTARIGTPAMATGTPGGRAATGRAGGDKLR